MFLLDTLIYLHYTMHTGPFSYTHTSELSLQESAYTNTSTVNSQIYISLSNYINEPGMHDNYQS